MTSLKFGHFCTTSPLLSTSYVLCLMYQCRHIISSPSPLRIHIFIQLCTGSWSKRRNESAKNYFPYIHQAGSPLTTFWCPLFQFLTFRHSRFDAWTQLICTQIFYYKEINGSSLQFNLKTLSLLVVSIGRLSAFYVVFKWNGEVYSECVPLELKRHKKQSNDQWRLLCLDVFHLMLI